MLIGSAEERSVREWNFVAVEFRVFWFAEDLSLVRG